MKFMSRRFTWWMVFALIADEITYARYGIRYIAVVSVLLRIMCVL